MIISFNLISVSNKGEVSTVEINEGNYRNLMKEIECHFNSSQYNKYYRGASAKIGRSTVVTLLTIEYLKELEGNETDKIAMAKSMVNKAIDKASSIFSVKREIIRDKISTQIGIGIDVYIELICKLIKSKGNNKDLYNILMNNTSIYTVEADRMCITTTFEKIKVMLNN